MNLDESIRIMKITDYENVYRLWTSTLGMGMRTIDDSFEGITRFLQRNPNTAAINFRRYDRHQILLRRNLD